MFTKLLRTIFGQYLILNFYFPNKYLIRTVLEDLHIGSQLQPLYEVKPVLSEYKVLMQQLKRFMLIDVIPMRKTFSSLNVYVLHIFSSAFKCF